MKHEFKVGDHVEWNSEAGYVQGRPHGDAQRCGSKEAQEKQSLIQETVTALDEEMIRAEFYER